MCSLRVMTACGVCPASTCVSRSVLGLPPLPSSATPSSSSSVDQTSSSDDSNNGPLIGGIVGGMVGLAVILGVGIFCYLRRSRAKRGKLPFAFTNGSLRAVNANNLLSQEKFPGATSHLSLPPPTPHHGVASIGMTDLTSSHSTLNLHLQQQRSSPLIIQHTSTLEQQRNHINSSTTNNSLLTRSNSINTPLYNNNNDNTTTPNNNTTSPTNTAAVIPEEFQEKIALQNKRISQILNNNPRLSQHTSSRNSTFTQANYDRNSGISYTTDDDSEFDDEHSTRGSVAVVAQVAQLVRNPQLAAALGGQSGNSSTATVHKATRAKAQIMRVNSVKTNQNNGSGGGGGLSRSESVRTVLVTPSPTKTPPQIEEQGQKEKELGSSSTTVKEEGGVKLEDPFIDTPENTILASSTFGKKA